jgi:uncharacterized Zn finger protein (UPF0148 family)
VYCPKCGDPLKRRPNGELTCDRGEMALSQHIEQELTECFVDRTRVPSTALLPFAVGGSWFCPGCGAPMGETEPGLIMCVRCNRSIGEFIRELVDLHPHKEVSAS